jgi:chromosomal replication initiation ATPase DnaA
VTPAIEALRDLGKAAIRLADALETELQSDNAGAAAQLVEDAARAMRHRDAFDILADGARALWGATRADLTGPSMRAAPVRARHAVCYVLYAHYGWSYPRIGRAVGREHTTVMGAVRSTDKSTAKQAAAHELLAYANKKSK